jgi:peptide/nickel transport system permease protein
MRFRRYALERIVATVGMLFVAVGVAFLICHVIGFRAARGQVLDPDPQIAANRAHYVHQSFGDFLWQMVGHGSLGHSLFTGESVAAPVLRATTVTLSLVAWALFLGLLVAVPLGLAWERRPRWTRWFAPPFVYVAVSLLPIWVGLELSFYLGYDWELFPISGYADFFYPPPGPPGGPVQWAYHLILPGFVLGLPVAAVYTRVVRALARRVRRASDRAPAAERAEAARRARTAALVTLLKGLLRDVGLLIGAAVFVETIFSLPGLGRTVILAASSADAPFVEGTLVLATVIAVTIHLVGNLLGGAVSRYWRLGS